jgi:N-sulfoglucosamine sulfohydrolase
MPSRRQFLGYAATALAAGATRSHAAPGPVKRPNVLLVLTDNQSWCHTSAAGDPVVRTPAFDRIAAEGMYFTHAFAPSPSCTPSRSAILTGQDMWRLGVGGVLHGGLPAEYPLYTDLLRDAGYQTGYSGKGWGPGRWDLYGRDTNPVGTAYNRHFVPEAPKDIFRHDHAANLAECMADCAADQPFCFWMGPKEPHRPYAEGYGRETGKKPGDVPVPAFLPDNEVIRNDFLDYYAEIEWQDRQLGRVIELLEEKGELDNTLIIATSDNGIQMPRGITTLYDYGVHVPLAIRWGRNIRAGASSDAFVNLTDLAPSFLEAAGLPVPDGMTGKSLLPLLRGEEDGKARDRCVTGIERHALCRPGELPYPSRALRTRDWLYLRNYEPDRWPAGAPDYTAPAQGVYGDVDNGPAKTWMLAHSEDPGIRPLFQRCFGKRPGEELYYLPEDPDQVRNLAGDPAHRATLEKFRGSLHEHLEKTGDPRAAGKAPWDKYPYHYIKAIQFRDQFTNPHVIPSN